MKQPTRTNPVYAKLSRRRAILGHIASLLSSDYTSVMGSDEPEKFIIAEDVFPEDNPVPEEEVQEIIHELELEADQIRLEQLKFNFVKQDDKTSQVRKPAAKKKTTRRQNSRQGKK